MSCDPSASAATAFDDERSLGVSAEPPLIEILEHRLSRREPRRALVTALGLGALGLGGLAGLPLALLRRLKPTEAEATALRRWKCPTDECGYIYDPAQGDPERGVAPGTAFEDLPADWVCPNSGTPKERFSPLQ